VDDYSEADMIEWFEERLAIMTIDGEAKEREAVRHAYAELRRRYGSGNVPEYVKQKVREAMRQE